MPVTGGSGSFGQQVVDLGQVPSLPADQELFGISIPKVVGLATIDSYAGTYGVTTSGGTTAILGLRYLDLFDQLADLPGVDAVVARDTVYFLLQADGGGRRLLEGVWGDDSPVHYFELWKNGAPYSFTGLPLPEVQAKKPSGQVVTAAVEFVQRECGRFAVALGELDELGDWLVQVRFIEDIRDGGGFQPWRGLPKPLLLRVRAGGEGVW